MDALPRIDREVFIERLSAAVDAARQDTSHLGLLLIDLTNLARINHHHGYSTGDQVLLAAYTQLLTVSKLPDTVFRVGSHRFAFILSDLGNPAFIALAMNKVQRVMKDELHGDSDMIGVDVKVGLAINRAGSRDVMTMLALTEASLAHVKRGGTQRIEDILAEDAEESLNLSLEQRFMEALQDNAFELHYQPKVNLHTGLVTSAEALLRWRPPPQGEYVSPEIVVELAESKGKAYELSKWVVHRGLRQLKAWQGNLDIGLAVNIQASLVGSPDLSSLLHDAIAIWGVDPGSVTVEITESAIIHDKQSGFDNLSNIRNQGVKISIDDFGTGYSSLSYFKHIPAAELKIDKSFVDSMLTDNQDLELVKIIINIAHQFGLAVVAEGVEDQASLDMLRELGCDVGQGYYFSKPLPLEEFENWVRDWNAQAAPP
jgi:diguanylate cyclase (GGDEF)-like protein